MKGKKKWLTALAAALVAAATIAVPALAPILQALQGVLLPSDAPAPEEQVVLRR